MTQYRKNAARSVVQDYLAYTYESLDVVGLPHHIGPWDQYCVTHSSSKLLHPLKRSGGRDAIRLSERCLGRHEVSTIYRRVQKEEGWKYMNRQPGRCHNARI